MARFNSPPWNCRNVDLLQSSEGQILRIILVRKSGKLHPQSKGTINLGGIHNIVQPTLLFLDIVIPQHDFVVEITGLDVIIHHIVQFDTSRAPTDREVH